MLPQEISAGGSVRKTATPKINIIIADDDLPYPGMQGHGATGVAKSRRIPISDQTAGTSTPLPITPMMYNDYGELVEAGSTFSTPTAKRLTTTQVLRLIDKAYHNKYRSQMREILLCNFNETLSSLDSSPQVAAQCTSWEFVPSASESPATAESFSSVPIHSGTPRILDVGCGDGDWCFSLKQRHPDWRVQGVDDSPCWLKGRHGVNLKDFMLPDPDANGADFCDKVYNTPDHDNPEFTIRNVNALLMHTNPIPHNLYSFVRGRDVFDKVESYRTFLDDVRLILQPEGVVEFLEIDPRFRKHVTSTGQSEIDDHVSRPQTDWTNNIIDRFREPSDLELDIPFPFWNQWIEEHLKAQVRPKDGIPAVNLKLWLEAAGFWDVKEVISHLPIGGTSVQGKKLLDLIRERLDMENTIPSLVDTLSKVCIEDISRGDIFINLHNVTARKPSCPRAGDMMMDGTRKEMTAIKYDAMARMRDGRQNQWQRFDLDSKLKSILDDSKWMTYYGPEMRTNT